MSKPWAPIGAWAADAERAEAEELEYLAKNPPIPSQSFPSLKEAATAAAGATKSKKKKPATMSLSEFTTGAYVGPGSASRRDFSTESKGLTPDEMLRLPTGPKERSAEEMEYGRLGGGFKNYGGNRSQGPRGGEDSRDGSWGGGGGGGRRPYGGFDDERRTERPPREIDLPSRADEVDNWAMSKKSLPATGMDYGRDRQGPGREFGDSGRQDRYSALGGGSRADEVDNWALGKKPLPVRSFSGGSGGGGGGFGSGFRGDSTPASDSDRWSRSGPLPPREVEPIRERTRLVFDKPRGDAGNDGGSVKSTRPSPFGAARPREEILAEKGLDWKKLDSNIEAKKTSRPTSSHSSRPSSPHSNRPESPTGQGLEIGAKPRVKVNPFGDAKPREVLLQEKGKDWRKIDFELEHRSVDRPETMEEQLLKGDIDQLKKELEKESVVSVNGALIQGSDGEQIRLRELILAREKDLELLICELDDKVRFGQKATERPGSGGGRSTGFPERPGSGGGRSTGFPERPGSGGGRSTGFPERPPSQSGMPEHRNMEYVDRPRSRGTADVWTRPTDDRRGFQGGREGGFLSNREDRPRSGGW